MTSYLMQSKLIQNDKTEPFYPGCKTLTRENFSPQMTTRTPIAEKRGFLLPLTRAGTSCQEGTNRRSTIHQQVVEIH